MKGCEEWRKKERESKLERMDDNRYVAGNNKIISTVKQLIKR